MTDELVAAARARAHALYAGEVVGHRSCGIAIAETFGRVTAAYQSLRRGGLTGHGECGAVVAGRLVLGELYGDPSPSGATTDALKRTIAHYEQLIAQRLDRGNAPGTDRVCNTLTSQFASFRSPERHQFCTGLAATVAEAVAEVIATESAEEFELPPFPTE